MKMSDYRSCDRSCRSSGDRGKWLGVLLLLSFRVVAEPTPVADEALLLFLADMVEVDGELTDALDMLEINTADVSEEAESTGQTTEIDTVEEAVEQ